MKQVIQNMRSGDMSLIDVPPPKPSSGEVLVATRASLISAGTEKMLIDFANKNLFSKAQERPDLVKQVMGKMQRDGVSSTVKAVFSRLEEPLPLGYSASGEVVAVGAGLEGMYKVGDRVAMAGAGIANHAELNCVPKNLLASIPSKVPYEQACYATLASIAMQGFRNSKAGLGDRILVMGLGLVGQLTVQLAKAAGCHVFAMDFDAERVRIAEDNGAEKVHNMSLGDADAFVQQFTFGRGFDSIIICAATDKNAPVEQAAAWARDKAKIVMTGKTGTSLPYSDYMKKELDFVISRSYGPGRYDTNYEQKGQDYPIGFVRWTERENLEEVLRLMESGDLNVDALTSHKFPIEEALDAYNMVLGTEIPTMGVVLTYDGAYEKRMKPRIPLKPTEIVSGQVGLSFIGAGAFARSVLLPQLKNFTPVSFVGILSKGGMSAATAGDKFSFNFAASEEKEIWESKATQAVVIASRHDSHARLVCEALTAGKHVFVEKPLAMDEVQLEAVEQAYNESGKVLMVGFNRRFSPYVKAVMGAFKDVTTSKQLTIRVNAGRLPGDNWQNDLKSGGGRLIGEVCHFVDLALYMIGSELEELYTLKGEAQDNYSINMRFKDGSLATIQYTSEGDTSFSKERVELFAGGKVGVIDNFAAGEIVSNGKKRVIKVKNGLFGGKQDKGHHNQLVQFIRAVKGESPAPIPAEELFYSTRVTLLAQLSSREQSPIRVN